MQSCFSIFSGGLLLFLPDTPRWYYARDRHEEGDKTLALSKKVESTAYRVDSAPTQNFCQDWGKRARLIQARLIHLG